MQTIGSDKTRPLEVTGKRLSSLHFAESENLTNSINLILKYMSRTQRNALNNFNDIIS